ncbi:NOP13 (YNL175C) [Zygosaccharomyces parabailii]|nr:NOP13 (YNL175C) [Zygosaccharomyces parabailii]CDH09184.1 probable Nucleolar protein 13 [Zygosaccharomyces bailii ISA1307]
MVEEKRDEKDEQVQKALEDTTKKRKAEDEIEIDLSKSVPLSKKQKRLLRRGKTTLEELNAKFNLDPASVEEYKRDSNKKDDQPEDELLELKKKEKRIGVWIGNLSFDTTKEDLVRFFLAKTKNLENDEQRISEDAIVRVHMPLAQNDGKRIKNKGFCYVDFKTREHLESAVALSELQLNGRNLLIKDSDNYEGRPDKNDLVSSSKNPPSRILFVGNLSFDTSDDLLKKHFQHCGEIIKIRMATFQDSGKCKGFAFVDFKDESGATNALKDKSCRKIAGRPLRMEYGEDRSKRQVKRKSHAPSNQAASYDLPSSNVHPLVGRDTSADNAEFRKVRKPRNNFPAKKYLDSNQRQKSSIALASAQRASAAIVPSQGTKVKFD